MTNWKTFAVLVGLLPATVIAVRAQDGRAELDPQQFGLSHLEDRTELAFEESDAYYAVLDHARHVPLPDIRTLAAKVHQQHWQESAKFSKWPEDEFPQFYDLTKRPEAYRGQPITMRGHLVRLVKYAAGPNEHGIDTLYEGWLVTPDSETHPATVICTEIPPGLPIGEELTDGVSVTGYFFKLHTYPSRDKKIRFAPMILAHRLQWSPVAAQTGWPISQPVVITGIVLLAAVAVVVAVISSKRTRLARDARFRESVPETPPEFLNDMAP